METKSSTMESLVGNKLSFFKGKKVFITGHTGFKGSWLTKVLIMAGAEVTGFSLEPSTNPSLFELSKVKNNINSIFGDVRDLNSLMNAFVESSPEIAFHLAAQPLVRESYKYPQETYETNIMGTVNFLECVKNSESIRSVVNVTTDKVYENKEWVWGYRENESLNGFDPYSNSKSCSELITQSYKNSFFLSRNVSVSTARAGNVIGGGDFAVDRIIPDCVRSAIAGDVIKVRNPNSVRPYQHVLEPLSAYLLIAEKQYIDKKYEGAFNVGPDEEDCLGTGDIVSLFCEKWGNNQSWISELDNGPHEANFLKLDCSKIKTVLDWKPHWDIEDAIVKTVEWTKVFDSNGDIPILMEEQIEDFYREF